MEKLRRKLFFWSLVVLFLIITPVVVLRARGYRFDLHRGVFVHSGTISIKNNPQTVDILIDGEPTQSNLNRINNSYNISGLIPNNYNIEVKADGFQAWNKTIDVHSGLAAEFWNILLVRNNYEDISYSTGGIDNFFISPKNNLVAFTNNASDGVSLNILNINDQTIGNTFHFTDGFFSKAERKENIEWSPEENYLSVPLKITSTTVKTEGKIKKTETATAYKYFVIDMGSNDSFILNDFLSKVDIRNVRWDPKEKDYLFFLSENNLYRANIRDVADITLVADNVSSYDLGKTAVYYTQLPNEILFKTALDGKSDKNQITSNFPEAPNRPNEKLIVYDEDRVAFINQSKDLFIYNNGEHGNYFRKLASGVESIQFSDDGKKLLYWTGNEIAVYYLRDWNVQPLRTEDSVESITRFSTPVENVQWLKDYEHVIFSVGSQIKVIELDPRDHKNIMDLPKTSLEKPLVTYNNSLEYLFFIDQKGEVPDLYSIIFPEKITLLGF